MSIATAFCFGCSSGESVRKPESSRTYNVQVFVVTQGGENIKLGLVSINGAPMSRVQASMQAFVESRKKTGTELEAAIAAATGELSTMVTKRDTKRNAIAASSKASEAKLEEDLARLTPSTQAAAASEEVAVEAAIATMERVRDAVSKMNSDAYVLSHHGQEEHARWQRYEALNEMLFKLNPGGWKLRPSNSAIPTTMREVAGKLGSEPELRNAILSAADAVEKMQTAHAAAENLAERNSQQAKAEHQKRQSAIATQGSELSTLSRECDEKSSQINSLRSQLQAIYDPIAFYNAFPPGDQAWKTNADGRAEVVLVGGEPWVLWARAERRIGGSQAEKYVWIVPVNPSKQAAGELLLSNDNMFEIESCAKLFSNVNQ